MRFSFRPLLDRFIPDDIREFEQQEELVRARALVFIVGLNVIFATVSLVATLVFNILQPPLSEVVPYTLTASLLGYSVALWLFSSHALYAVSGNLYALTCYVAIVATASHVEAHVSVILVTLAMPVVVSLIANHASAMFWLLAVVFVPKLVAVLGGADLGDYFFNSWLAVCVGLFFALFMEYRYRHSMHERLNAERTQFEFAAAHDPLTGLANRATFDRRLQESIEFCRLHDTKAVLLYIDLDKFKPINDTHGHQAGDIVLTTVASRMRKLVRASDTVARLGGDEFAILFEQCDPTALEPLIERISTVINQPIEVFDRTLSVDCSIGKVICPDDGLHPEQLSHKADERMYAAKREEAGLVSSS